MKSARFCNESPGRHPRIIIGPVYKWIDCQEALTSTVCLNEATHSRRLWNARPQSQRDRELPRIVVAEQAEGIGDLFHRFLQLTRYYVERDRFLMLGSRFPEKSRNNVTAETAEAVVDGTNSKHHRNKNSKCHDVPREPGTRLLAFRMARKRQAH